MKDIKLKVSGKALGILMMVPNREKGTLNSQKRLVRIRKNLFRELAAINKELKRHKPEMEVGIDWVDI